MNGAAMNDASGNDASGNDIACFEPLHRSHRWAWRCLPAAVLLSTLIACASGPERNTTYTVRRGDTLYSIAQRHRVTVGDLTRWNRIERNVIYPGQVLHIQAPGPGAARSAKRTPTRPVAPAPAAPALPSAPPVEWQWPVDGGRALLTARPNGGNGLMIRGTQGQEIRSAASGQVVYTGSGLLGYGQLLIVKHNNAYLSAYGHTQTLLVHEGDYVVAGQRVATMGTDPQGTPALYFEIRINGVAGNPLAFLPRRP